jgi:hypothetical protein
MAQTPAFEVRGGPELRRALRALEADLRDLSTLHKEAATVVRDAAAGEAPHLTGRLAGSLRPTSTRTRARVESRLPYALPIHYGWRRRHIAPNRFGDRAIAKTQSRVMKLYEAGIDRLLKKAER